MTAAARAKTTGADLRPSSSAVEAFTAHVEASALLWQKTGKLAELPDTVDALQRHAEAYGFVAELGQDEIQSIMSAAFAVVRNDLKATDREAARIAARIRPLIADSLRPTKERIRILWAAAKAARHLAADDVRAAFMALAVETNLINRRGRWTNNDVREDLRRYGAQDVEHVIAWALRGWNPFERGPLK